MPYCRCTATLLHLSAASENSQVFPKVSAEGQRRLMKACCVWRSAGFSSPCHFLLMRTDVPDSHTAEGQTTSLCILRQPDYFPPFLSVFLSTFLAFFFFLSFFHSCSTLDRTSLLGVVGSAWKSGVKIAQFTGCGVPKSPDQWGMAVN